MAEYKIPMDKIESFLHGFDDEKYIVNVEFDKSTNTIYKIKEEPITHVKYIEEDKLTAFLWIKNLNVLKNAISRKVGDKWVKGFYGGSDPAIKSARDKHGIDIVALKTGDNLRLFEGFKYLVTSTKGYESLMEFFKDGGLYPYDKRNGVSDHFMMVKPIEQYLIGTGKRLFKGFEEYNDIHKMVFDIETTGLDPEVSSIFLIGMKDNGPGNFEYLIETNSDEDSEANAIRLFFKLIDIRKPSIIGGYNSANFDWPFIWRRAEILGLDVEELAITLNKRFGITKQTQSLKIGGEVEDFEQVSMWGYNIIDIIHSARRAQAIDSDMKSASLKYVCKYNKIAKKNRVYVNDSNKGGIGRIWADTDTYYFDEKTGSYSKNKPSIEYMDFITRDIMKENPKKMFVFGDNDLRIGKGGQALEMRGEPNVIGIRTKKVPGLSEDAYYSDNEYDANIKKVTEDIKDIMKSIQAGKTIVLPSAGVGTGMAELSTRAPRTLAYIKAMIIKLEEYCESFSEVNGKFIIKRYLMDDLWETMEVDNIYNQTGFMLASIIPTTYQRVTTMGTAGLWKMLMQAYSWENNLAIPVADNKREFVGGLSRLLKVGYSKELRKMDFNSLYPAIQLAHDVFPEIDIEGVMKSMLKYFHSERFKAKELSDTYKKTDPQKSSFYKRKQLPLKIFINALFGALGAPQAFPWAEINVSERITCIGRQYLRLMVKFFIKRGYTPLVLDTDGVNFMAPIGGDEHFRYVGKGLHSSTELGKEYKGVMAIVCEFNDHYMKDEMGLGLDGIWPSTINMSRKNYATLEDDGSVKKTGNSIKSKKMAEYIEEFLDKGIRLLLVDKGNDFIELYYDYVTKLCNKQIPIAKIASRGKVKKSVEAYKNRGLNVAGKPLPKQAHMELIIQNNLKVNMGDVVYYLNLGNKKSASDVGADKEGNSFSLLLSNSDLEEYPERLGDYNVSRYLDMFNKKVEPLLICFDKDIRDKILIADPTIIKKKTQKQIKLDMKEAKMAKVEYVPDPIPDPNAPIIIPRYTFMLCELDLVNGQPDFDEDQDTLEELFTPSDMEIEHWNRVGYDPLIWKNEEAKFMVPGLGYERDII